jgi:hypothetical protein
MRQGKPSQPSSPPPQLSTPPPHPPNPPLSAYTPDTRGEKQNWIKSIDNSVHIPEWIFPETHVTFMEPSKLAPNPPPPPPPTASTDWMATILPTYLYLAGTDFHPCWSKVVRSSGCNWQWHFSACWSLPDPDPDPLDPQLIGLLDPDPVDP